MRVSVVIPAFNEERTISKVIDALKHAAVSDEIIVVDDGSTDNTPKIVREKAKSMKSLKLISNAKNRGKGAAMRVGLDAAHGDAIVFFDADGQFDPSEIPKLVSALKDSDIAMGARDLSKIPWPRKPTNALAKLAVMMATGKNLADPLCGFRAARKQALKGLKLGEDRFTVESEMNLKAVRGRLRLSHVPISVTYSNGWRFNKLNSGQSGELALYLVKSVLRCWIGAYK